MRFQQMPCRAVIRAQKFARLPGSDQRDDVFYDTRILPPCATRLHVYSCSQKADNLPFAISKLSVLVCHLVLTEYRLPIRYSTNIGGMLPPASTRQFSRKRTSAQISDSTVISSAHHIHDQAKRSPHHALAQCEKFEARRIYRQSRPALRSSFTSMARRRGDVPDYAGWVRTILQGIHEGQAML